MMDDDTPPDPLADLDQMLRAVVDVAKVMHAYHAALSEQGFSEEQALALTIAYQTTILQAGLQ